MITADQQELFDTLVSQHGGADKLSRVDLEKILAIVKTTGALRQASGPDVPRVAGTLIKLSEELRRVAPKATGKLITAKMSLHEMAAEYQRAMRDVDYEIALERDAIDQAVDFLRDKLSAEDLREARRVIDHAVRHAAGLMREAGDDANLAATSATRGNGHEVHANGGAP
jgi:hypothetical protein